MFLCTNFQQYLVLNSEDADDVIDDILFKDEDFVLQHNYYNHGILKYVMSYSATAQIYQFINQLVYHIYVSS